MSECYLGELRLVAFDFPPKGWAFCDGQTLPIQQNQALFAILGTMYGGNGVTTFQLPDLRGRMPIHMADAYPTGTFGGEAAHQLSIPEMPAHNHPAVAQTAASTRGIDPTNSVWAASADAPFAAAADTTLSPAAIGGAGGNVPHENRAPYLVLNFVIALQGIFPSRA